MPEILTGHFLPYSQLSGLAGSFPALMTSSPSLGLLMLLLFRVPPLAFHGYGLLHKLVLLLRTPAQRGAWPPGLCPVPPALVSPAVPSSTMTPAGLWWARGVLVQAGTGLLWLCCSLVSFSVRTSAGCSSEVSIP